MPIEKHLKNDYGRLLWREMQDIEKIKIIAAFADNYISAIFFLKKIRCKLKN